MKFAFMVALLSLSSLLVGCTTTGSYIPVKTVAAKPKGCPTQVFMPGQKIENEFEVIGSFSVQEMGLSINCGWEETLEKNKENACANGAEAIQFLAVDAPSIRSTCYTSKANFIIFKK